MKPIIFIDGEPVDPATVDGEEIEPGFYSILHEGQVFRARMDGSEVVVNGHRFAFEKQDQRRWGRGGGSAASAGHGSVAAPMPGKVVRVLVTAGDQVEAGQGIVVVEAMKMQNELKSPRAAKIAAVRVTEGESVNAGAILVVFE